MNQVRNVARKLAATVLLASAGLTSFLASGQSSPAPVDAFVYGLSYDPRVLLATRENGATEALPGREGDGNKVIICTNKTRDLTKELSEVTILSPVTGVVFPGALVRANRNLADGKPDAITLPRSAITLRIDLPGMGNAGTITVDNPTNSSVQGAIDEALKAWLNKGTSFENAARSKLEVKKGFSTQQLALELGFNSKWAENEITSHMDVKNNSKRTTSMLLFKQIFYSVTMDLPQKPSQVWAPSVDLGEVRQVLNAGNPPAYIRSVDYGRIILVRMDTNSAQTSADVEGTLKYVTTGGAEFDSETKNKFEKISRESTFTVMTLGGNAKIAANITGEQAKASLDAIRKGAVFGKNNAGYPIAYTVAFLKDHQFAKMAFSTSYNEAECTEYNNGFVRVKHDGGYVGKFKVVWSEGGAPKQWESGETTSGYQYTLPLPGDAKGVQLQAWGATGLVWEPWREAMNRVENGPTNKCYRITGTTLAPGWDYSCPN
ncbi:MAG TPA: thiol-activated cytolysin family protein [Usitatibacteraceae bacterium]